jgi:hypothetical protein
MAGVKARMAIGVVALAGVVGLVWVPTARAGEFIEGEEVVIAADQVIEDDLYVSAGRFVLAGKVLGDLIVAASSIEVNGQVEGDLLAVGQSVAIDGSVADDVRAAGAALELGNTARIGGDAALAGFSLNMLRGSQVAGDLMWGGGQALLAGEIGDDLLAGTAALLLDSSVGGDVRLSVGGPDDPRPFLPYQFMPGMPAIPTVPSGLTIGSAAQIAGNLDYSSSQAVAVPAEAVAGEVLFTQEVLEQAERRQTLSAVSFVLGRLRRFVGLLLIGLLLIGLARRPLKRAVETLERQPLASLGWGLLALLLLLTAAVAIAALMLLVAGLLGVFTLQALATTFALLGAVLLGLLLLAAAVAIVWLAPIAVCLWLGRWILRRLRPAAADGRFGPFLLGLVVYVLVSAVPWAGALVTLAVAVWGMGAWALAVKDLRHDIRVEASPEPSWF